MDATPDHDAVEARFLRLIDDAALTVPDAVEYYADSVVFLWHATRTAVVIDLVDEPDSWPAPA